MPSCKICNINDANQTGAHIFPAWMIASAFDKKVRNRDYEIIHAFQSLDNELPYFGRSVQPEEIEESIGRALSEEEAESQKNFFVVDNLWCHKCENKFKIVEDYFLEKIDRAIVDFSKCNESLVKTITVNVFLIRLFIYSIIYRASITKLMGFTLDEKSENNLKRILNNYIQDDLNNTISYLESSTTKNELWNYPVRCVKMETEKGRTSNFVYLHKKYDKPYCFILNNYIFQFYSKEKHLRSTPYSFFGITDLLSKMDNLTNVREFEFRVGMIDLQQWEVIKSKFIKYHSPYKIRNFMLIYEKMFRDKFGYNPSKAQTQKFLNILVENNLELGIKYTEDRIIEAMNKSLTK